MAQKTKISSGKKDNRISRKDFLKKTFSAGVSFGILGKGSFNTPFNFLNDKSIKKDSSRLRILGRTGIKVNPLGFGASRIMEPALVKKALDEGMDFFDTGRSYFEGRNEVMLGKLMKGIRKDLVIQSKIKVHRKKKGNPKSEDAAQKIKEMMESSLNESLRALQTDYIDIMLLHGASSIDLIHHDTVMASLEKAKKHGKIRAIGFSTHSNQNALLRAANESKFYDVVMVPYNHKGAFTHSRSGRHSEWDQSALEKEMILAEKNGIAIVAMKTCSAGPFSPGEGVKPSYRAALQWILEKSAVRAMAVAMANFDEIRENIGAIR